MPRVPKPADLRDPQLAPAGGAAQINIGVASNIGAAGRSMGNAIAALGGAFGEVASRVGQTQDSTNAANYKLEWLKGDAAIRADLEANAGEDGALYATAPERYKALNDDLDKRYPVSDPKRRESVTLWREENTFRRGIETAKTYQSRQAGVFLKGFEADVSGIEERILRGEVDPSELEQYGGALREKLEGMDRNVIPRSEVERRSREIQGRLAGAFARSLVTPGSKFYDPDAAAKLADDLEKGSYEIDGPGYQGSRGAGGGPGLGQVSARYESGGRGVAFISSGKDDPGGQSYGVHQLSGAYSMGAFLRSPEGAKYRQEFGGTKPQSAEFNAIYRKIAQQDPEGFAAAQKEFYTRTHYEPVRQHAEKLGFNVNDRGVQEALFSMGVQHAGAKTIVSRAAEAAKGDVRQQITALYEARTDYVRRLTSLPDNTKQSVLNRYRNEVRDALKLAGQGSDVASNDNTPSQVAGYQSVVPSGAQAEFGRLMQAAQQNPDRPLREVINQNLAARIAEDRPDIDLDKITVGEAAQQLQGVSVGDAEGTLGEAGLSPEQAMAMFAEGGSAGSAQLQGGGDAAPDGTRVPRVTGRLQPGQTFTVRTPRGDFTLTSEQLNAMPAEARKAYSAMAREQAKLAAVKRDRQADEMMRQQIASLEEFGTDAPGFDMKMLEAHYARKGGDEFPKFQQKVQRLRALSATFEGAANYDIDMLQERVEALKPKPGERDIAGAKEIYDKAQAKLDAVVKQRETDPAAAVDGSGMVSSVREAFPNGRPTNPAQNLALVDARLRAQADIGIGEQNRLPLTKAEARGLAEKIRGLDEGKAYDALQALSDDVRKKYGERYSGLIIGQVVKAAVTDRSKRDTFVSVMRGLDEEGKISGTSIERIRQIDELNAMGRATKAPAPAAAPSRSIGQRLYDSTIGMIPPEITGAAQNAVGPFNPRFYQREEQPKVPRRNPPPAAVDALKRDPSKAADFEAYYGLKRGESRRYLID